MSYRFAESLRAGLGRNWFHPDPAVWHIPLLYVQWKTPDDGQGKCPKHVEFYSKNKFEKLVRLVCFITRIYHDARSPERQICCNMLNIITQNAPQCMKIDTGFWHLKFKCLLLAARQNNKLWQKHTSFGTSATIQWVGTPILSTYSGTGRLKTGGRCLSAGARHLDGRSCYQSVFFYGGKKTCGHFCACEQWRTEGGWGVQPSPRNSEGPPKSCQTQPDCEHC